MFDVIELSLTDIRYVIAKEYNVNVKQVDFIINNDYCIKTISGIRISKGVDENEDDIK